MVFKKIKTNKNIISVLLPLQSYKPKGKDPHNIINDERVSIRRKICLVTLAVIIIAVSIGMLLHARSIVKWTFKINNEVNKDMVLSCYYNLPSSKNISQLMPSNIDPYMCTHLIIAFAQIKNKEVFLEDFQIEALPDLVKLKKYNPELKVLLSVGGAGNNNGFSEMVINHASRKIFIKSIKTILKNFSLDGIDLDWEFPVVKNYLNKISKRERQHFSQLLREIRTEYIRERRNYILTVALAAQQIIVDVAYDVDQINMYVDFANIMTYDFHTYTSLTAFTGFNSPLYAKMEEHLYISTLNINYTVQMYKDKGLDVSKIVIGIPTYGHSFTLVNPNNHKVGSPSSGFGSVGNLGFVNQPDICTFARDNMNSTVFEEDEEAMVPYLYKGTEWISYDNAVSVARKATFVYFNQLRGAMVYSLNADDYNGLCEWSILGKIKFPLTSVVSNALNVYPKHKGKL